MLLSLQSESNLFQLMEFKPASQTYNDESVPLSRPAADLFPITGLHCQLKRGGWNEEYIKGMEMVKGLYLYFIIGKRQMH